jgi:hypothetical protein
MPTEERITLREFIEQRLEDLERCLDAKFHYIEDSTTLAKDSMERRLDGMNEFRETLRDQSATMLSRAEFDAYHNRLMAENSASHERIEKDMRSLELSRAELQGKASQTAVLISLGVALLSLLLGAIGIVIQYMRIIDTGK